MELGFKNSTSELGLFPFVFWQLKCYLRECVRLTVAEKIPPCPFYEQTSKNAGHTCWKYTWENCPGWLTKLHSNINNISVKQEVLWLTYKQNRQVQKRRRCCSWQVCQGNLRWLRVLFVAKISTPAEENSRAWTWTLQQNIMGLSFEHT